VGQTQRDIPASFVKPKVTPAMRGFAGPFAAVADKYKCFVCHSMDGAGGTLAPDLTIEGSIVKRPWLMQYLTAPDVIRPFLVERMPKLNISPAEAETIADYFFAATRHDSIQAPVERTKTGNAARGKTLYATKYNCKSCHTIGKEGGYYGPPLDNVGNRLEPAWMHARLLDAHRFQSDSREPRLVDNETDAQDITEFLSYLRKKGGAAK
jgi:mono/diheme cytochrome c family protein